MGPTYCGGFSPPGRLKGLYSYRIVDSRCYHHCSGMSIHIVMPMYGFSWLDTAVGNFGGCKFLQKDCLAFRRIFAFISSLSGIERFHVTSQSRDNHTGGHFGVQLNGDLVRCMMRVQNAAQTWQLMDLPHKLHVTCEYMLYVRRERTGCIVPDFPMQAPIYLYTKTAVMRRSITELYRLT